MLGSEGAIARASRRSARLATRTSLAPSPASCRASAAPMPLEAPVRRTVLAWNMAIAPIAVMARSLPGGWPILSTKKGWGSPPAGERVVPHPLLRKEWATPQRAAL